MVSKINYYYSGHTYNTILLMTKVGLVGGQYNYGGEMAWWVLPCAEMVI